MIPWLRLNIYAPRTVDIAGFTPTHGWFVRFTNGTVQWAEEDKIQTGSHETYTLETQKMSPCFHALIHSFGQQNPQRQENCIDFLTFVYGSALLVRYENGNFDFFRAEGREDDCDSEIVRIIEEKKAEQWALGGKSRLCWWDKKRHFLEFVKGAQCRYQFNRGGDAETTNLVTHIIEGHGNDLGFVQFSRNMHWVCQTPPDRIRI